MNDFTEEELHSLVSCILIAAKHTSIENWEEDLLIKIQSMIDNYCEREFVIYLSDALQNGRSIICVKCKKEPE